MTRQTDPSAFERTPRGTTQNAGAAETGSSAEPGVTSGARKFRRLLLGHRGVRATSHLRLGKRAGKVPPENTLAAFQYALAHGCDGFEFDVRITRDERLVLCHDVSLQGRKIARSSYDSLCSRCEGGLPCLDEVLAAFGDRAFLDIEIKVAGGEELVLGAIWRNKPRSYTLSSFLPEVLLRLHALDPSLPLGYICDRKQDLPTWRELPIQVFLPQYKLVSEELVRDVHNRGMQIFTWTVNREEDMRQLAAWGIDGLISDDPKLLSQTLAPPKVPARGGERTAKSVHRE